MHVENDRMEIVSFPSPDRSVTIEGVKNYRVSNRRYRNRRIGDFLKEQHLAKGRNKGFKKIIDALEANGSPKPEFETDEEVILLRDCSRMRNFVVVLNRSRKGAKKEPNGNKQY